MSVAVNAAGIDQGYVAGCDRAPLEDFVDAGTWNYRRLLPRACEVVQVNPPMFHWPSPSDFNKAAGWSFVLRDSSGQAVVSQTLQRAYYRHPEALPPGDYEWQVSYDSKRLRVGMVHSGARRFRVPENAEVFLPPDGRAIVAAAKARFAPRILPDGSSFAGIRELALNGEYANAYAALLYRSDQVLAEAIPEEPAMPPSPGTAAYDTWSAKTRDTARSMRMAIEALAFAWRFTGDGRYRSGAVARLTTLARWDPAGSTSDARQGLANTDIYVALARGFDLCGDTLTPSQRKALLTAVRARIASVLPRLSTLETRPYLSLFVEVLRNVVDALLWTAGHPDFPEADGWLADNWDQLLRTIDTWGDVDGGWGNGVAYGWYALTDMAEILVSIGAATGFDFASHPWIRNFPSFLMAHTAPTAEHFSSSGDGVEFQNMYTNFAKDWMRLVALVIRNPEYAWYWQQGQETVHPRGYLSPFHFIALARYGASVTSRPPTRHSWLFRDAGAVAIHNLAAATGDRSSVYFRSSRFGSYSHSFADQNGFALISRGKSLLIPGGYYPWFLSKHHALVGRATRYKNALTFDGGIGQAEPSADPSAPGAPMQSMDARGELTYFETKDQWTAASGDATLAYRGWNGTAKQWRPLVTTAFRTVAYHRDERVLVVYDYASGTSSRRWELNFNALAPFDVSGRSARVAFEGASGCIDVYGAGGAFSASKGFAVAPERTGAQQYQARFTSTTSTELAAVTVIREDCRDVDITVERSGTSFTVGVARSRPIVLDRGFTVLP
jgi:hypothetical protein